jgi:type I restriction enzyme S subunit
MKPETKLLGEFVEAGEIDLQTGPFGTQLRAADYASEGTPVINVRNIGFGCIRPEKLEYIPEFLRPKFEKHFLAENDIVFGRKGAVDRHLYVSEDQKDWMQGSDCIRLRVLTEKLNPRFLSYSMLSNAHKQWMLAQCGNKATMASLNQEVICRIPVKVPSRPIQDEIADILSAYDDLIENNRRRMELLEQSARLLFKEWFVHLRFPGHEHTKIIDGVPEGWERCFLPDIIDTRPKEKSPQGDEVRYVPMSALSEAGMTVDVDQEEWREKGTAIRFRNGDTLLARITPCLENGKTAFVNFLAEGEVATGSTEFIVLRGTSVSPYFTYCLARTYGFREVAIKSMTGASGRQRVNEECFDDFLVPRPPKSLRLQFDEVAGSVFDQISNLMRQNQQLAHARDILLPRLMSGEVAV